MSTPFNRLKANLNVARFNAPQTPYKSSVVNYSPITNSDQTIVCKYLLGEITTSNQPNITSLGNLESLSVLGPATFYDKPTFTNGVDINGDLVVAGGNIYGNVIGTLVVNNLNLVGNIDTGGYMHATANLSTDGNLDVGGVSNLVGNVSLSNGLSVSGISTLSGNVITGNNLVVGNSLVVVAETNLQGNLLVNKSTQISNTLVVNGPTILNGALTINNAFTINNSLVISGTVAIGGATSIANSLSVYSVSANGDISASTLGGTLTTNAQPNITSVGTLSNVTISSNGFIDGANSISANFLTGTLTTNAQPNITSVGNLTSLIVTGTASVGNITFGNINGGNLISANFLSGTLTTNAQPNITSVGTLTSLSVSGNITSGNVNGGNLISANFLTGTLTTNAQPNITSVGTLTSLDVSGNISGGNLISVNFLTGTLTTNAQPNITSVGTLTSLDVSGNANINGQTKLGTGPVTGQTNSRLVISHIANTIATFNQGTYVAESVYPLMNFGSTRRWTIATGAGDNKWGYVGADSGSGADPDFLIAMKSSTGVCISNGSTNLTDLSRQLRVVGNAEIIGTDASTSTTTGAFVVSGGVGVSGNINAGNISGTFITGTLTTNAQPNITSVGQLSSLIVSGTANFNGNTVNTGSSNLQIKSFSGTGTVQQILNLDTHSQARGGGIYFTDSSNANIKQFLGRAYNSGSNIQKLSYTTTTTGEDVFQNTYTKLDIFDNGNIISYGNVQVRGSNNEIGIGSGITYLNTPSINLLGNTSTTDGGMRIVKSSNVIYMQPCVTFTSGNFTPIIISQFASSTRSLTVTSNGIGVGNLSGTSYPSNLYVDGTGIISTSLAVGSNTQSSYGAPLGIKGTTLDTDVNGTVNGQAYSILSLNSTINREWIFGQDGANSSIMYFGSVGGYGTTNPDYFFYYDTLGKFCLNGATLGNMTAPTELFTCRGNANITGNIIAGANLSITSSITANGHAVIGNTSSYALFLNTYIGTANIGVQILNSGNGNTIIQPEHQATAYRNTYLNPYGGLVTIGSNIPPNTLDKLYVNGIANVNGNIIGGNVNGGNLVSANFLSGTLNTTSSAQPNITSVGTLSSLVVSGLANVGTFTAGSNGNATLTVAKNSGSAIGTYITSDGVVSINKVSPTSGYFLDVNGAVQMNSNVVLTNSGANVLYCAGGANIIGNINAGNANINTHLYVNSRLTFQTRAWIYFNYNGTLIQNNYGLTVSRTNTGQYVFTFQSGYAPSALPYLIHAIGSSSSTATDTNQLTLCPYSITTNTFGLAINDPTNNNYVDPTYYCAVSVIF